MTGSRFLFSTSTTPDDYPMLKVGLLIPNASFYPHLPGHFSDGLHLALEAHNIDYQFFFESSGNGARQDILLEKAQKMYLESRVDLLIAYASNRSLEAIAEVSTANRRLLYGVNLGTKPMPLLRGSHAFFNSLGLWESAWHTGHHLGSGQQQVFLASGCYDSGYRISSGFEKGLTNAGGSITGYKVMQHRWTASDMDDLINRAEASGAETIFAVLSQPDVEDFMHLLSDAKTNLSIHGGGLSHVFSPTKEGSPPLLGHVTWHEKLRDQTNQAFVENYEKHQGELPSLFSQMGHEAGLFITAQMKSGTFSNRHGYQLGGWKLRSARGPLELRNGRVFHPQYAYSFTTSAETVLTPVPSEPSTDERLWSDIRDTQDEPDSGWTNPYPCG